MLHIAEHTDNVTVLSHENKGVRSVYDGKLSAAVSYAATFLQRTEYVSAFDVTCVEVVWHGNVIASYEPCACDKSWQH